jgi:hypothetical protein
VLEAVRQRCAGFFRFVYEPVGKRFGAVEREHGAAARVRLHEVRKPSLKAGALVAKRERLTAPLQNVRQANAVFFRLNLVWGLMILPFERTVLSNSQPIRALFRRQTVCDVATSKYHLFGRTTKRNGMSVVPFTTEVVDGDTVTVVNA